MSRDCAVRIGVHTGVVVAGEVGKWDTRASMAVVLVEGSFVIEELGPRDIHALLSSEGSEVSFEFRHALLQEAAEHYLAAGLRARRRSAHTEAVAHLKAGLRTLQLADQSVAGESREIDFQSALARSHMARGLGSVERERGLRQGTPVVQSHSQPLEGV